MPLISADWCAVQLAARDPPSDGRLVWLVSEWNAIPAVLLGYWVSGFAGFRIARSEDPLPISNGDLPPAGHLVLSAPVGRAGRAIDHAFVAVAQPNADVRPVYLESLPGMYLVTRKT